MGLKIYHQVGHNANWNVSSFEDDGVGDGLILSPVHQPKNSIEKLSDVTKNSSFFDPQFYLPNSQKKKLHTYEFFPEIASSGFDTVDFGAHAHEAAQKCVEFQIANNFDRIIIPARFFPQMITDFQRQQEAYTVTPFLDSIRHIGTDKPVFITLPLTSHMVMDVAYRTSLLNWITKFPDIDGVYTFIDHERTTKQIQDADFMYEALRFFSDLRDADLDIVVGYTNSESLIYSLIGDVSVTFGSFENTRIFSIDKFLVSDDDRRGPKARIYLPGLFNWIQFGQAREIRDVNIELWNQIYVTTKYGDAALDAIAEPHFNQPDLYKHHFIVFAQQLEELQPLAVSDRYDVMRRKLRNARRHYQSISANNIDLEVHGSGEHIDAWLTAINRYYRNFLS